MCWGREVVASIPDDREALALALGRVPAVPGLPAEQAALKVLYLAVRNLQEYRGATVGIRSSGWKKALQAFTIYIDGRIPHTMTATIIYTDGLMLPEELVEQARSPEPSARTCSGERTSRPPSTRGH